MLTNRVNKTTVFINSSARSEIKNKNASTEIFGCLWMANETYGNCISARAPFSVNEIYWAKTPDEPYQGW